jgi:hypothetical protein
MPAGGQISVGTLMDIIICPVCRKSNTQGRTTDRDVIGSPVRAAVS